MYLQDEGRNRLYFLIYIYCYLCGRCSNKNKFRIEQLVGVTQLYRFNIETVKRQTPEAITITSSVRNGHI